MLLEIYMTKMDSVHPNANTFLFVTIANFRFPRLQEKENPRALARGIICPVYTLALICIKTNARIYFREELEK